ncbi:MAG: sulfatase [Verrucomicrobiota bacterium]|nr:sulfatase [Verrucomicrobiota bacterium]
MRILFALLVACVGLRAAERPSQPNVLWITAEDMSPVLGCYGDEFATTPNIDRLAKESVRYTKAFASAPVCSPSRSCLITGCYPTSLSTQQMRSGFAIPKSMRGFPALLRARGYYTTNNVKTDYNTGNYADIIKASWNESSAIAHWRMRSDKAQPFFSVFNLMTSHQSRSMVWPYTRFKEEVQSTLSPGDIHDPDKVPVPPYYPDTPLIRRELARFYDCVTAMDLQVGTILKQLEEDGLAENTIVFFYSDHGSGMPRHKRALLDSGMHVPLIIRFPKKWQHLAPSKPGSTTDRLVSFVDYAPTVLNLLGQPIPKAMQGEPFLGPNAAAPRRYVYGHRDRVDEVRDLARSVRDARYLYIRNYMPHLGYNQPTAWPDSGEIRHEFYRLAMREKMTDAQRHFAGPTRPVEELYDCQTDPQNLNNLARSRKHRNVLDRLRAEHIRHITDTADLGFLPESEAWKLFDKHTGWELGQAGRVPLDSIHQAAAQVGLASEREFLSHLESANPTIRYWGAIGLAVRPKISGLAKRVLQRKLNDPSMAARIEMANALATHGDLANALPPLMNATQHENLIVVTHAVRTIELLGVPAAGAKNAMALTLRRANKIRPPDTPATVVLPGDKDLAMFVAFSCRAFLERLKK